MTTTVVECVHYWACDPQAGPVVSATCRNCGAERAFAGTDYDAAYNMRPLYRTCCRCLEEYPSSELRGRVCKACLLI